MAKFIRKIDRRTWLTDVSLALDDRIEIGFTQFKDLANKPSVYAGDTQNDIGVALAAVAWEGCKRDIGKIKKTDYVVITDEQISRAGLQVIKTPATIVWARLRGRHYELTRHGKPCTDSDLRRLVQILIEHGAEHGREKPIVLKQIARIETTSNPFRRVFMRLRMWWGSR